MRKGVETVRRLAAGEAVGRCDLAAALVSVGLVRVRLLTPSNPVDPRGKYAARKEIIEGAAKRAAEELLVRTALTRRFHGSVRTLRLQTASLTQMHSSARHLRSKEIPRNFNDVSSSANK